MSCSATESTLLRANLCIKSSLSIYVLQIITQANDKFYESSITAIVIVVLGIILGFSMTYWAKTNDKWCFQKPDTKPNYDQAPTSDPDIVKSKPAEDVTEEKDKVVVDNPV